MLRCEAEEGESGGREKWTGLEELCCCRNVMDDEGDIGSGDGGAMMPSISRLLPLRDVNGPSRALNSDVRDLKAGRASGAE